MPAGTTRAQPANSPPMWLVLPFFLAAPFGLIAGGLLLQRSGLEAFVAINARETVAVTHALVLGWVSTVMMGACYQLGPVVLGGEPRSQRLVRVHFVLHATAVGLFVWSMAWFNVTWVGIAGSLLYCSIALFLANVSRPLWSEQAWSIPRAYLLGSTVSLGVAATVGLTFAGNLEHHWFVTTPGRLAAHAHLGLVGWLGLTIMGVSYQLVPMFNVANRVKPRLAMPALFATCAALAVFALVMSFDPGRDVRVGLALALMLGPLLWAIDQVRLLAGRAKRQMDIHGRATTVSLLFLGLTVVLGAGVAWGTPFGTENQPARWPLAYAIAGVSGWAGTAILANSYKIVPFLVWYHRYRPLMGREPVPVIQDIYSERLAMSVLVLHTVATSIAVAGALTGNLDWLQRGGLLLALGATVHFLSMALMLKNKSSIRRHQAAIRRVTTFHQLA
jgi:hypothetical protein